MKEKMIKSNDLDFIKILMNFNVEIFQFTGVEYHYFLYPTKSVIQDERIIWIYKEHQRFGVTSIKFENSWKKRLLRDLETIKDMIIYDYAKENEKEVKND